MKKQAFSKDLSGEVLKKLLLLHKTIAFAESVTAGLAAARLVDHAGASDVLNVSFITYAPEAKIAYTDVTAEVLETEDVVSEPVARLMASGVRKRANADVGVGITGYAGPGGGTHEIPVGTVVIGLDVDGETETHTLHFENADRNEIRIRAVDETYALLFGALERRYPGN